MDATRRKFSTEQKIKILQQASTGGVTKTLQEHKLSYSVFARWKQQLDKGSRRSVHRAKPTQVELDNLETENLRLKKIVANMALELDLKSEQIKRMEHIIAQY